MDEVLKILLSFGCYSKQIWVGGKSNLVFVQIHIYTGDGGLWVLYEDNINSIRKIFKVGIIILPKRVLLKELWTSNCEQLLGTASKTKEKYGFEWDNEL